MPLPCERCGGPMRSDRRMPTCRKCRQICVECGGKKKTWHGTICRKCCAARMGTTAKRLWEERGDELRDRYRKARRTFDQLTWECFYPRLDQRDQETRYLGTYWPDGATRPYAITRYRWLWMTTRGPIPDGFHVHHINGDTTDDRIENIDLMSPSEPAREHWRDGKREQHRQSLIDRGCVPADLRPWMKCQKCGKRFQTAAYDRGRERKYCSTGCFLQVLNSSTSRSKKTTRSSSKG